MKKTNTIGKTITGLTNAEFEMIVRALKARYLELEIKSVEEKDNKEDFELLQKMAKKYNELAKFIKAQQ